MNSRQRTYESYDYTSRKLKILNSIQHQHQLHLIQTRKAPKIVNSQSTRNTLKKATDPISQYFKVKNDQYIAKRLKHIKSKRPKLNDNFIIIEEKNKKHNMKVKQEEAIKIKEENERMIKRIESIKSFISTKDMDRQYETEHKKMIRKLRKILNGKLLLPNITPKSVIHSRSNTEATYDNKSYTHYFNM